MAQLTTAGMYIVAARLVTPAQFGPVVSLIATATAAVGFFDFGTNSLWVREIARGSLSTRELGRRIVAKLSFALFTAIIWVVVLLAAAPSSHVWAVGPVGLAMLISQTAQVPLRGMGRADLAAVAVISDRFAGAVLMGSLIAMRVDPPTALWIAITVGSILASVVAWKLAPAQNRGLLGAGWRTNPWSGAGFYGVSAVATSAQSLDLAVMNAAGGAAVTGVYGAVNRWTQPLGLLVGAFSSASVPFVARAGSWRDAWEHVRSAIWLPIVAIGLCIAAFLLSPVLVNVLIGSAYDGSARVLQILALATIPGIINQPLAGFLQAVRYDRAVAVVMMANVVLVLAMIALLSGAYGAVGAAMAALITQSLVALTLGAIALSAGRAKK